MTKITENHIETFAIEILERLGYEYIYAPEIAPDSENPQRESFQQVLLVSSLEKAIKRINPTLPIEVLNEAIKEIEEIISTTNFCNL